MTSTREDADGDGVSGRAMTATTVLNVDGSRTAIEDVHSSDDSLLARTETTVSDLFRSQEVTTISDNTGDILETSDINCDGQDDHRLHHVIGDDGTITITVSKLNSDRSLQSRMLVAVLKGRSAVGLQERLGPDP